MNDLLAANRAPYGRLAKYAPPGGSTDTIATYYGQPQLKPSHYGFRVALYMFIAGLSGAAQLIATAADLAGADRHRNLVRRGRYLSLLAVGLGPPLLIWDLHTPQRFYNMLRIFRRTSPMSIGTYVLSGFALSSTLTAAAQLLADRRDSASWRRAARVTQIPAALAGAGLTTYTAALLSATSTPLWAAAPRGLAVEFAGSSIAAGAAALILCDEASSENPATESLELLEMAAAATELAGTLLARRQYRKVGIARSTALDRPRSADHRVGAIALGAAVPLALLTARRIGNRPRSRLGMTASLLVIGGSLLLRWSVIEAGNASARRAQESLRFARSENAG
jgi:protein NrfD